MTEDATQNKTFLFTSEQVSIGHPDKLCDYVSDSILDACLSADPNCRVACETAAKGNCLMVFGEITAPDSLNIEQVARNAIKEIGYDSIEKGFSYKNCQVIINIDKQSSEIEHKVGQDEINEQICAGDQGIMFGYATNEHESFMPISYVWATQILQVLREKGLSGEIKWNRPDAKSQITVEYEQTPEGLIAKRVHTVLVSTQHSPDVTNEQIFDDVKNLVIKKVIPENMLDENTKYFLNPSGSFVTGGPYSDAGLTGRKIIADTYGGWGSHGGGCFSGKDCTKVDRSGAYAGRWIAKSLVSGGFCKRCLVQVSYGIGIAEPLSILVNSYGTSKSCGFTDEELEDVVKKNFDLNAGAIRKDLQLRRPIFKKTTCYGHFLKKGDEFLWENPKDLSHEGRKNNK